MRDTVVRAATHNGFHLINSFARVLGCVEHKALEIREKARDGGESRESFAVLIRFFGAEMFVEGSRLYGFMCSVVYRYCVNRIMF